MNSSKSALVLVALAVLALPVSGCYLVQSAVGQFELMHERRPIDALIADPAQPPALRTRLAAVAEIRDFATRELALPDNGSYRSYADLHREYAVWNVVAAPEFSIDPIRWCFPVVGCVAYRGYFVQARAQAYARRLRADGDDVAVEGVAAYSTLGHFDDPVLNTMLGYSDTQLASIIFHELTHQLVYVAGDASFDEALATTVEEEGVRRWLHARREDAQIARRDRWRARQLDVLALLQRTREALARLYASGIPPAEMRARKRAQFEALRAQYATLTADLGPRAPFADWFDGPLDNARLASLATYYDCVPGFERELRAAGGDLPAFYRRVRALARLPKDERDRAVCAQP